MDSCQQLGNNLVTIRHCGHCKKTTIETPSELWEENNGVQKIDWPSMTLDLPLIGNIWQLLTMKLKMEKAHKLLIVVVSAIKH